MIDDMAVYIANLGKYNEGYLVGAWFTFPIDEEDVKEKIGLNEQYEEYSYAVRGIVPITKIHPNGIVLENTSKLLNTNTIIMAILFAIICFSIFTLITSVIFSQREGN